MKLEEFSITNAGIVKALKAKGYKRLGSGVDQTAFLEPGTGYVLKVFGTQCSKRGQVPTLSPDQKMFKLWANFCAKNQNNPHLPRIYGWDTFVWTEPPGTRGWGTEQPCLYLQIRTEPLRPVPSSYSRWLWKLSNYADDDLPWNDVFEDINEENIKSFNQLTATPEGVASMQKFYKTMQSLAKLGNSKGFSWDLHPGNIMLRGDGTLIINDPWVL